MEWKCYSLAPHGFWKAISNTCLLQSIYANIVFFGLFFSLAAFHINNPFKQELNWTQWEEMFVSPLPQDYGLQMAQGCPNNCTLRDKCILSYVTPTEAQNPKDTQLKWYAMEFCEHRFLKDEVKSQT